MKECFIPKSFGRDALVMIAHVVNVVDTYEAQGYDLTLRQIYYQMVGHDLFPDDRRWTWTGSKWIRDIINGTKNAEPNYKWLGVIVSDARLAGLIDWDMIKDRTRNLESVGHWNDPSDIVETAARSFRIDKWDNQPNRVEVWVEKDALIGVLEKACRPLDVAWFSCRGYTSQSELYGAGKRLLRYIDAGQKPVIIHLGDHDPSGIDMTRDIQERLSMFAREEIEVNRIALNMDQVRQYNPPPNPAKTTDARYRGYRRIHGDESWELDALAPQVIDDLISTEVQLWRDDYGWGQAVEIEEGHRRALAEASDRWDEVAAFVSKPKEPEIRTRTRGK